jgi:hypothetical protein
VVARDQFVDDAGPLPDHHPARVLITLWHAAPPGGVVPDLALAAVHSPSRPPAGSGRSPAW